jgi:uncharacterized membrane protein/gas vesicle protein
MNKQNSVLGILAGIGTGAAAMYFLDPDKGARRRAIAGDKIASSVRRLPRAVRVTKQDLTNRAHGVWAETQHLFANDQASDDVIEARVRSKMGRVVSHPHAIRAAVSDGIVYLSGPILADEVKHLLKCVKSVAGVRSVEDHLQEHETAEGIPALQGGTRRISRAEFLQENWSPAARFIAGTAGTAAVAYGFLKRDALSITLGTVGAGLVARSVTNTDFQSLLGFGGQRAITIQKSIDVEAPADVVFALWSNFENFPRFMENIKEIKIIGPGVSHWKAAGPAGTTLEWDAEITWAEEDRLIAWKSLPGSAIASTGIVKFQENLNGTTNVDIQMSYNPPAGAIGHAVATILGVDPKSQIDADLMRMKTILETGELPRESAQAVRGTHSETLH